MCKKRQIKRKLLSFSNFVIKTYKEDNNQRLFPVVDIFYYIFVINNRKILYK